ncbi:MAG: hypothetical protein HC795_19285 [Coleofasciculaceae cyanobacterium RL_1_1]|nr:hypothetical protein [Coleofasciculaceae cyanobacterium RL_1_1]
MMVGTAVSVILVEAGLFDDNEAASGFAIIITVLLFVIFNVLMDKIKEANKRNIEERIRTLEKKCEALSKSKEVVSRAMTNLVSFIDKV